MNSHFMFTCVYLVNWKKTKQETSLDYKNGNNSKGYTL